MHTTYRSLILLLFLAPTWLLAQPSTLDAKLFNLPDIIFQKIDTPKGFEAAYELQVRQPVDHADLSKGYFYQRAYLSHRSFEAPMVIATEGYHRPSNRLYELTNYLEANQLDVEHRYFGTSLPDNPDYKYLNLKQATADLHHIRELLGQIYQNAWVSTGISKGGQTTIFYRYFYPEDVAAAVPYVAPLNLEIKDQRIYTFLDTIGSDACRQAIREVQLRLLKNRDEVLPRLKWYAEGAGYQFTYLTLEQAFEYGVLEYPFSFWQVGAAACEEIPDAQTAELDDVLQHFMTVTGLSLFTDESMTAYASHYWQAGTEMGYYGYETDDFKGLLKAVSDEPSAIFMPGKVPITFEPSFVKKVYEWTQTKANHMIYINGGIDTWSATGVPPTDKVDALWFIMPGKNHATARIRNMGEADRERLLKTLGKWMDEEVKNKP
ncbi:MAG: hypothetical protein KDD01_10275 [Phaeodactylibacter sp.]|nr:hypothetical protein [Phaeodactylibacter sp.]